jgi:NTE family protein
MTKSSSSTGTSRPELSRRELLTGVAAGALTTSVAGSALPAQTQAQARDQGRRNRKLLLGGGGIKGAYQAGVVKALLEEGFVPNVIYGVSVGALNAAFLVDRASFLGKPRREYHAALNMPIPIGGEPAKPVDWPFIGDELVRFWTQNIRSSGSVMRKKRTAVFAALLRRFNGLYDSSPLRSLVNQHLDLRRIKAAHIPISVFTVNLNSWQGEYFDEDQANLLEAIVASASLPIMFPIADLDGRNGRAPYVDGGLRQNVPVAIALAGVGDKKPTHLVTVACQSARQPRASIDRSYMVHLLQLYADIAAEEMLRGDLKLLEEAKRDHNIDSIVLRPATAVAFDPLNGKPFELDNFEPRHIEYLSRKGYQDGLAQIAAVEGGFAARGFR